ncbi:DUF3618 domain-containing protein [Streptomyces sp. NPDC049627]|uniref:DUF3618 domain-containing protein n=1 Tax=Streptomyces sp. NPDC049627 TaxID=3365595 RepID=UPI00378D088F
MTHRKAGDKGGKAHSAAKAAVGKATGGAKGPDELRRQIERTRKQLGDTVEELAGKADVKGRARARAADLRDKAGAMTVQLRSTAAHAGHTAQDRATRAGHTLQDRATHAGHALQDRATHAGHAVQDRATQAGHAVQDRTGRAGHTAEKNVPYPLRTAVRFGLRHPGPVVATVVLAVIVVEVMRKQRQYP